MGAGTQARRAALAHLLFNVFGVIWVLIIFYPFVNFVCSLVGYNTAMSGQTERLPIVLAMFHTLFNITNTLLLISFIPQIERIVCWMLPEKQIKPKEEFYLQYIQANLVQTPEISVLQAQKETLRFAKYVHEMFSIVCQAFNETDEKQFEEYYLQISDKEEYADRMEIEIANYLGKVSDDHLSDDTKRKIRQMIRVIGELESIADSCYNQMRILERYHTLGQRFTSEQIIQLQSLMNLCDNSLNQMLSLMQGHRNKFIVKEVYRIENEINNMRDSLKTKNIENVNNQLYDYKLGMTFGDMVTLLERLNDYIVNVIQTKIGK
jgi:phosphate:Na+ symporter